MTPLELPKWFLVTAILLMLMHIAGIDFIQAAEDSKCLERSALCNEQDPIDRTEGTYRMGKLDFSHNQKPNAFWASKPTGKFTKQEIFEVCAQTAMLGYTAIDARVKGKSQSENVDRLSTIMTGIYVKSNQTLREREPLIYERTKKLYDEIGGKLYGTAFNGGERSLANLLQREGFEQFYPKLISGCYKNLASW